MSTETTPPNAQAQAVVTTAKPAISSRTLWINAIALALAGVESQLGVIQPFVPVNVYALLAVVLPLINMVLRMVTGQPVQGLTAASASGADDRV